MKLSQNLSHLIPPHLESVDVSAFIRIKPGLSRAWLFLRVRLLAVSIINIRYDEVLDYKNVEHFSRIVGVARIKLIFHGFRKMSSSLRDSCQFFFLL